MPYIGKTPSQATRQRYYLTASGGETSVSGTMTVGGTLTFTDGEFVDVSVNGVALVAGTDYNTNTANTIAGLSALSANDQVEIVVYDTFSVFSGDIDSNLSVGGNLSVTGTITGGTLEATADTSAGDSAAIGFTSAEGLILTGQGSTSDITLKNDADATVFSVPTGTDDILFPDNAKAIFGAGSDLQIYHDGNNSYVEDAGSGYLVLKGSDPGIALQNSSAANLLLTGTNDISLLFSGNAKLATTNTGVDITGTAVTDGLTSECAAGDSNLALTAYHPTSTSARNIAKFQSNVGSTQADVVTIGCDGGIEAVGEITTTNALSQSSNSIRTVIGNDGGSATFGTSTNHQVKLFTNNTHVATLTTGGALLINQTTNSAGNMFRVTETAGNSTTTIMTTSTSYATTLEGGFVQRAANSAYSFQLFYSSGGGDLEFNIRGDGNAFADGSFTGGGADYAEYFEWEDGNSSNEDRRGYSVVLVNNKIRKATSSDAAADIIGVVSANPSAVGDAAWNNWSGKYLRDDFGSYVTETHTSTKWSEEVTDEDGIVTTEQRDYETDKIPSDVTVPADAEVHTKDDNGDTLTRRKLNPDYDATLTYVSREDRQEWDAIGMVGKLRLRAGQPTGDRWIKMRDISDSVEEWLVR